MRITLAALVLLAAWWHSLQRVLPKMTPKRRNWMMFWIYAGFLFVLGLSHPFAADEPSGRRFLLKLLFLSAWALLIAIVYN
ncbi:MAG: hypothetical protein K2J53_04805, partial [Alistipes sp.]|nr:hypothetical protein [Alistipes sp.]